MVLRNAGRKLLFIQHLHPRDHWPVMLRAKVGLMHDGAPPPLERMHGYPFVQARDMGRAEG